MSQIPYDRAGSRVLVELQCIAVPSNVLVDIDGVPCRVWRATMDGVTYFDLFVHRIGTEEAGLQALFDRVVGVAPDPVNVTQLPSSPGEAPAWPDLNKVPLPLLNELHGRVVFVVHEGEGWSELAQSFYDRNAYILVRSNQGEFTCAYRKGGDK